MAKESVKARQRKRERMVAQYADKRAALKAAGDWKALDELPKNSSSVPPGVPRDTICAAFGERDCVQKG